MNKKVKYAISISLVVIILCLAIVTLVMALVPVGSNDKINLPDEVYIYSNQTKSLPYKRMTFYKSLDSDSKKINDIFDSFNDGFKQNALSALFKGELGKGLSTNYKRTAIVDPMSKNYDNDNAYTVVFHYKEAEVLNYNNETYKYNYLFFEVKDIDAWDEVIFGVSTGSQINEDDNEISSETIPYNYSYSTKASLSKLHNYLSNLFKERQDK